MPKATPELIRMIKAANPRRVRASVHASQREGWHEGYTYRANIDLNTIPEDFDRTDSLCEICGEFHRVPFEGAPGYIRENRPLQAAKNWVRGHLVDAYVERRRAFFHHRLSDRTMFPGTSVNQVEEYGEWEKYKRVMRNGTVVRLID